MGSPFSNTLQSPPAESCGSLPCSLQLRRFHLKTADRLLEVQLTCFMCSLYI